MELYWSLPKGVLLCSGCTRVKSHSSATGQKNTFYTGGAGHLLEDYFSLSASEQNGRSCNTFLQDNIIYNHNQWEMAVRSYGARRFRIGNSATPVSWSHFYGTLQIIILYYFLLLFCNFLHGICCRYLLRRLNECNPKVWFPNCFHLRQSV